MDEVRGGRGRKIFTVFDRPHSESHFMAVLEPLRVRLPPTTLEFVTQFATHMKRFQKLTRVVADVAKARSPQRSPRSPRSPRDSEPPVSAPLGASMPSLAALDASLDELDDEELSLPDLLNTNTSGALGQITVALSLKGILFELDCQPVTEVLCSLSLGRLDFFVSSMDDEAISKSASSTNLSYLSNLRGSVGQETKRNYLNLTFYLQRVEAKVYNRWIKTDTVGVELLDIGGNVGRRQDVLPSGAKDSVVSGFGSVRTVAVTFALASLKSWFVVQELWVSRLKTISFPDATPASGSGMGAKPSSARRAPPRLSPRGQSYSMDQLPVPNGPQPPASTGATPLRKLGNVLQRTKSPRTTLQRITVRGPSPTPRDNGPRNRVTVLLGVSVVGVSANADLGLVGTSAVQMGTLSARVMIPLDDIRDLRRNKGTANAMSDEKIVIFFGQLHLSEVAAQVRLFAVPRLFLLTPACLAVCWQVDGRFSHRVACFAGRAQRQRSAVG